MNKTMTMTMTSRYGAYLGNCLDVMSFYGKGEYEAARNASLDASSNAQDIIQTLSERMFRAELKASKYGLDEILVYFMITEDWDVDEGMKRFDLKTEMEDYMEMKGENGVNEENLADFIIWYYTEDHQDHDTGNLYDFLDGLEEFYKGRK